MLALVVITFIDLDHKKIPDRITYPGIPFFFVCGALLRDVSLLDQAIGAAAGYGVVRLISDGYYHLTGREGLGYGDGKLLALVGALLGWRAVLFSLFAGSLLGTVIVIPVRVVMKLRAKPQDEVAPAKISAPVANDDEPDDEVEPSDSIRHVELPFGPFLAAGAVVFLFLQDTLRAAFSMS